MTPPAKRSPRPDTGDHLNNSARASGAAKGTEAVAPKVAAARDAILAAAAADQPGDNADLLCPAHDDRSESLTVRAKGDRQALVFCHAHCEVDAVVAACGLEMADLYGKPDHDSDDAGERPDDEALEAAVFSWSFALRHDPTRLRWLQVHRGLSLRTITAAEIGWDDKKERYTIPVRDEDGYIVNVRRYNRDKPTKIKNTAGLGTGRLYPLDVLDRHDDVVLCESELDALLANQHGIPAVTGTSGAKTFKPEWAMKFTGKTVWIAYDCDNDGRNGAVKAARHIYPHAKAVHIVDLGLGEKEDVTDWFVTHARDADALRQLMTAAPRWSPPAGQEGWSGSFAEDVEKETQRVRIRNAARRLAEAEELAALDPLEQQVAAALMDMAADEAATDHVADMLTEDQIADLPPVEWVIDGWWQAGGYGVIYGAPGIGKTLVLIAAAKAVRRGSKWFGRKAQRGAVLFYEGEGLNEFRDRFAAFNKRWPSSTKTPEALAWHRPTGVDLTSVKALAAVVRTGRALDTEAQAQGDRLRLVIIEPLIENMSGDENGDGMDAASRGLRVIAQMLGCAVLVGHHVNASGERERGSDKLRARALTMARMERTTGSDVGLVVDKQRSGQQSAMELMQLEVGPSVVLELIQETSREAYEAEKSRRMEAAKVRKSAERTSVKSEAARKIISEYLIKNEGASERKVARECRGQGVGEDGLKRALADMVEDGEVRQELTYNDKGEVSGSKHWLVEQ